ncbi:uncharacterized protein DDB_G0284459-like [Ochlerotatus camptorhynchus]|uniref:uncharacterized protein DDB_G0284459-like n=1 Tax=Ochlerotatus camptorhynchus TaxID=644619 RepID=UPI0031D3375B
MNLNKLSKRHSIHSMQQQQQQQPGRQPPDGHSSTIDAGLGAVAGASKQRKKGKFRFKERSSSSVRERFVNDPAYTEDVRHLALPMRRNSGPEYVDSAHQSRKFYTIPKKKSNSVGKDYLRGSGFSVDVADVGRIPATDAAYNAQVKVRRKKYNYHNSSEMLRFNADESSSSDNLRKSGGKSSTLDRRGRSLDRRSGGDMEARWFEKGAEAGDDAAEARGRNRNLIRRQNAAAMEEGSSVLQGEEGDDGKDGSRNKFQIGKRFLKGEIGIKSFNYYLLKEGLKSSKKNLLKQRSVPAAEGGGMAGAGGLSKSEENIYEEIYFEEKPNDPSDEKIQFIDCELCVQQCSNSNCEACHSHVSKHKLQQHHHHQQQHKQSEKQNIYEQLKQVPPPAPLPGPQHQHQQQQQHQYKAVKSLDLDELSMYHSSSSTYGTASSNVLQYQSYNPNNPNVFKIETTPVAFGCEYNPIQQIYYKPQYGTLPGVPSMTGQQQQRHHIYQQPQNLISTSSDLYQQINRKKSSSSSDSLQARMQRELYQQASLYYYQRKMQNAEPQDPSKIYKTNSNASILSEMSARSESSLKHPRTGNMSDSSLGDSLFSYPANRRYFGSSESCRFASECRRCSLDVDKCSFSDTCRYDCRNCDCSSSYFSSDFDDAGTGQRKSHSRLSGNNSNVMQDNYSVPAYAEDFMKHVSNVKRNQLGGPTPHPQHPQQKQTPSGKIYETPTTYAGMSKRTPSHHEHTYETLKSNPYGSVRATYKYDENTKLSISHSHELLLSPSRSKFPLDGRYSMGAIGRYGPKSSSSTLPASITGKARSTEFGQLPNTTVPLARDADTLPKSFTAAGPPRATLSNLNHDYAEITQLPLTSIQQPKEQKQTPPPPLPPNTAKRSSAKYTAPQPPKSTQQPTTMPRRQAPPIPLNPPLPMCEPKSIASGDRDKSLPRRDRAEFERSKRGAAAAVAATIQDVVAPLPPPPTSQPKRKDQVQQQISGTGQPGQKKEVKKKMLLQQQEEDDGNFTDDEDDEVFLSDKVLPVYEKPTYGSSRKLMTNPPPKEQTTTNKAPHVAAPAPATAGQAVTGSNFTSQPPPAAAAASSSLSSSSSSSAAPLQASTTTTTTLATVIAASKQTAPPSKSKHREHQPEPTANPPTPSTPTMDAGGGPAKRRHSNESESLRSSHAMPGAAGESVSDLVRKSDEPAALAEEPTAAGGAGGGGDGDGDGALSQRIKTKSSPEELSTDLAVSGEASVASEQHQQQPASSGRLAAAVATSAAVCSNSNFSSFPAAKSNQTSIFTYRHQQQQQQQQRQKQLQLGAGH